jgi:hypothetical protein
MKKLALIALATMAISSCATIKPYEKEYLVHPLMDDGFTGQINPQFAKNCVQRFEHLSSAGGSGQGAQSCPTCGG